MPNCCPRLPNWPNLNPPQLNPPQIAPKPPNRVAVRVAAVPEPTGRDVSPPRVLSRAGTRSADQRDVADHRRGDVELSGSRPRIACAPSEQVGERRRLRHPPGGIVTRVERWARYTSNPASRTSVTTSRIATLAVLPPLAQPAAVAAPAPAPAQRGPCPSSSFSAFVTSSATVTLPKRVAARSRAAGPGRGRRRGRSRGCSATGRRTRRAATRRTPTRSGPPPPAGRSRSPSFTSAPGPTSFGHSGLHPDRAVVGMTNSSRWSAWIVAAVSGYTHAPHSRSGGWRAAPRRTAPRRWRRR